MQAKVYNQKGDVAGDITLPEKVFSAKWRSDLVHQVVLGMRSNKRAGTADTKGRGEVSGGGKKPWKQKGTGRARHGSSRSPIWVGGGVAHGPLAEKNYKKKISKSMRAEALFSVLSKKQKNSEIFFIDSLEQKEINTQNAVNALNVFSNKLNFGEVFKHKKPRILMALFDRDQKIEKSFRNIPQVEIVFLKNLNPMSVLDYKYLIIEKPEESVKFLEQRG